MHISSKIKKLRELKNLTQEYMADQLGITQGSYSKIESGEVELPVSRLEQIAAVLGLSPEDILSFNEQMVFNVMHNQTGNGLVIQNQLQDAERKLYQDQVIHLQQEIEHLKRVIEKVLG